ncbi:MAG: fimbrial biogenesis outer membrane usher protein, partial [Mesorhizobium sp.]
EGFISTAPPRSLDQVSVSVPLKFDPSTLNFSYTQLETVEGDRSEILGLSFNRAIGRASLFATAFKDLADEKSFGVFAGVSIPIGEDIHAST